MILRKLRPDYSSIPWIEAHRPLNRPAKKISGSGAREARFSTTSTRRSREKRSAYGPKCRVGRKKYPDRERAKRVSAVRVRVDRAKSGPHPDQNVVSAEKNIRIGGARSAFQQYEYAYIARKVVRIRTKMSCRQKKISGTWAREARLSTTSKR